MNKKRFAEVAITLIAVLLLVMACEVSGRVLINGVALEGVVMTLTGAANTTAIADANGMYNFEKPTICIRQMLPVCLCRHSTYFLRSHRKRQGNGRSHDSG